jgi:uncharacterized protein (TIGR00661 family)
MSGAAEPSLMARIFISMSGEGRGHATRVRSLVEQLRHEHEIWLFTPGDAHSFLAPIYAGTPVRVIRMRGLTFHYNERGRLAFLKTVAEGIRTIFAMPRLINKLVRTIRREMPDLVITDFEPALPRAARRCKVPFLSINHQHFLIVNDLGSLPLKLRWHTWYMSLVVRSYYSGAEEIVVSQFYFPPVKPKYRKKVVMTGVLLRPELLNMEATRQGHLLCYLRRFACPALLEALKASGRPVRVYGLGEKPADGNLTFHAINDHEFVKDLASCEALFSTAGNQLVGEALYFGKPVFAIPEPRNWEQYINAHYLAESGAGKWMEFDEVRAADVAGFLDRLEEYRARIDRQLMNGNPQALTAIKRHLRQTPRPGPQLGAMGVPAHG